MIDLRVCCLDCEAEWIPNQESPMCVCDDPAPDAWLLYFRDSNNKWVRYMMKEIELRHG